MKSHRTLSSAMLGLIVTPLLLVAGCPVQSGPTLDVSLVVDTYWVEYSDGQLLIYGLPEHRVDEGTWYSVTTRAPEWYTGPALYNFNPDGTWTRVTEDPNLTLDGLLSLLDPRALP